MSERNNKATDGVTQLGSETQRIPRRRQVYCRTQFEEVHCWPDAASFLRHPHRHLFKVKVTVDVTHSDRDVEFLELKSIVDGVVLALRGQQTWEGEDVLAGYTSDADPEVMHWSCERWAEELGTVLLARGFNVYTVEISEDGENGAIVRW